MARVRLIHEKPDIAAEHHELFDTLAALRGRISGPSSVVLHSPGLAGPWNETSEFLHRESIVEPPFAELAVCATAREFDCAYVWAAHAPAAISAGISEAAIDAIAGGLEGVDLPSEVAPVLIYARQLARARRVDDEVFDALLRRHGPRWLVELTTRIGRYAGLTCILNAFEVAAPPDRPQLPRLPARAHAARPSTPKAAPRVPLLTSREQVPETDRAFFDELAQDRGNVRGPFALLMYSPGLCRAILDLARYLRRDEFIPEATRELAVIATARERDCPYVWAAHAPAARRAGVPEAVVNAVRDGRAPREDDRQRDVVDYTRQLLARHEVDQALFDRLLAVHTLPGLVELTAVIAHYLNVTTLLNAFEVAPAPDAELLPLA